MTNFPKKKDAYVAIHGHFYQPPRENPWLEIIETEEGAHPFHDWNERIAFECYRPNGNARTLDGKGKILDILNNYSSISFNFGPTLLPWLEKRFPSVYQRLFEADRLSLKRWGHGNAIAQTYDHLIMPLANRRDKETEVLWGISDFEKRFRRRPDAMWLPETAVDHPTLRVLAQHGMRYLILSPLQALKVRPFGGKRWADVSGGRIDSSQPYRCFMKDETGKKIMEQSIDLLFYNGIISKEIAFGDLLKDGKAFCNRFLEFYQESKGRPQLLHIATDGETYGHHKKFGDMALAYALDQGFASLGLEIVNHGAFLKRFPPVYEVEIDEGPKGEGTSWSCSHGVGRWKEDCGCSVGGKPGWNQRWRKPLRESLDLLRDDLGQVFEREGEKIFQDVWKARDGYIEVILDRSPENVKGFFERYGARGLDGAGRIKGLKLLEMQRHALQMYTSCGWFFADLAGLETQIILQRAARAIQLAEELTGRAFEEKFLRNLSKASSNDPEMGSGDQVYQRLVKPKCVTLEKVVNHFAISSLFDGGNGKKKIFSYHVEKRDGERIERDRDLLLLGHVRVTPRIIPEPKEFFYALLPSASGVFHTWVSEKRDDLSFNALKGKGREGFEKGADEAANVLTSFMGNRVFTMGDTFQEERQALFFKLIEKEFDEHCRIYADLFDRTKLAVEALSREGLEIPYEIRVAAEVTLSNRLFEEIGQLRKDFEGVVGRKRIDEILGEAREHNYHLRMEKPLRLLREMLKEKVNGLREGGSLNTTRQGEQIGQVITLLDLIRKWGFEISLEEAQDVAGEILQECIGDLEKCWWGEGEGKPFHPQLVILAEKLGFNVDRYVKITGPNNSVGQP
jgi:alpha-amylase/alpha-mannosidase (GH57 family)